MRKEFINFSSFYGVFYFVLCLTAITSDFITSKGKSNSKLSKINFLYNSKILGSIIIVPVITMGIYSASTKHAVTYEELDKFNKVNAAIEGYWYYINKDTSNIESFNIRFNNTISNDESGDVEIQMMAYFDQNDNLKLSKTELENKIKLHYDCKISYPVKFESAFEIVSCDSINLKGSIINAKGEKIILIAYKERNQLEEIVRIKKEKTINQTSFSENYTIPVGDYTVKNEKCYFYTEPNTNTQTRNYLIKGDIGQFTRIEGDYIYAIYTSSNGKTTKGWIKIEDVEYLAYGE